MRWLAAMAASFSSAAFLAVLHHSRTVCAFSRTLILSRRQFSSSPSSSFPINQQFQLSNLLFRGPENYRPSTSRLCSSKTGDESSQQESLQPQAANCLYQEWTLSQDQRLWEHREKLSLAELSSLLGRGLNGVKSRLKKLHDVNSPAYERLFAGGKAGDTDDDVADAKRRLIPAGEVLRRIQYDSQLDAADFVIQHYDRVEDTIVESPMDAPNNSIAGKAASLVEALPEHRIVGIKYKKRVVWDREKRMDLVFSTSGGGGDIVSVIEGYAEWEEQYEAEIQWNRKQQALVAGKIREILGMELFGELQSLSTNLQARSTSRDGLDPDAIENYVSSSLALFRAARKQPTGDESDNAASTSALDHPTNNAEALDCLSELVAVLPNEELRTRILEEIARRASPKPRNSKKKQQQLPDLDESEFEETFVRGSGPGGQKINKTANQVVLVHTDTGIRVHCQETRSLQQNRSLARKRLRVKLDEYYNGSQSIARKKQDRAAQKKAKRKTRNKARLRQKKGSSDDNEE